MLKDHLKNLIAVTTVYPAGQKCDAAILEFDCEISNECLTADTFEVKDRRVVRAYANGSAEKCPEGRNGRFVVLELSLEDEAAAIYRIVGRGPAGKVVLEKGHVEVAQRLPLKTADGQELPVRAPEDTDSIADGSEDFVENTEVKNLLMDNFIQGEYAGLPYNLFIPKNYDETKKYPLVLFIHDAGCCSDNVLVALAQGIGAVVWTSEEEQKKHECFVLAPQFTPPPIVNDEFEASEELEWAKKQLDYIVEKYSIDKDRIYTTGQSMGCMSSCELNVRYPDLFAASLLVAGQWNPRTMATIPDHHFWILVSEGDAKAFPGMNAITEAMEEAGAKVVHEQWNAKASQEEWKEAARRMVSTGANVLYTSFDKETVAKGSQSHPGEHHVTTWQIAYEIEAVRDWLFSNINKRSAQKQD